MRKSSLALLFLFFACGEPTDPTIVGTDASEPRDLGPRPDAEARLDADLPRDASTLDATPPLDAAEPVDSGDPMDSGDPDSSDPIDSGDPDSGDPIDSGDPMDANEEDANEEDAAEPDAEPQDASAPDAEAVDAGNACDTDPCFPGVACAGTGQSTFRCGACPSGLTGDGVTCEELDDCAVAPCLPGSSCTDHPAPDIGYSCSPCVGATCPILRALAGPDQSTLYGAIVVLEGAAAGNNGSITCEWSNDRDNAVFHTCTATASITGDTRFELTVTDASGASASDDLFVRVVPLVADAGLDQNILSGEEATLVGSWVGAACADGTCVSCVWRRPDESVLARTCTATVSAPYTSQYSLTVSDSIQGVSASASTTVFVTDAPANLCGWDVVVMTSNEYPTAANPNYTCSPDGHARRQVVNGKPSIVLSDLVVENARIIGYIGVETSADDDHIGFLWGFQDPAHTYLLTWKQSTQNWTAACGNALSGIAVKKIDSDASAPTTISYNPSFGYNATDYRYSCADAWSTDRNDAAKLAPGTQFLISARDPGAFTGGWADFITYRFEIFHTAARSKILIFEDDLRTGSTANLRAELEIEDSSFPRGRVAFFSNSQEQVDFGDFSFASLHDFAARAGDDQTITAGGIATLTGDAILAVPPVRCDWSAGGMSIASVCTATVSPSADTDYALTVTDAFGRVSSDSTTVFVTP
ncbi:MAG: hypothetical protein HYV07_21250 [Deltaproteobacteria bacterium]|nr:hypothetical protein [Deltaproteobacteria bacterium]